MDWTLALIVAVGALVPLSHVYTAATILERKHHAGR